ncbi:hypothetical protein Q3G72_012078 [Acer saccharum]|nr:hypothetical protein Q3G72_012078 [Acer saccharum]
MLDPNEPSRTVKIGANLSEHIKAKLTALLRDYKDVFAWSHEDMPGIDTKVISHYLSVNPEFRLVVQKRRLFNLERSTTIKKEVEKLLYVGSIREVKYPEWVIGRNMEVYVDDMLTKSIIAEKHSEDLKETFDVLRKYKMKLNSNKCVFGVPSGRTIRKADQMAVELSEFDIKYTPKAAIKGQAVSDFVAEFIEPNVEVRRMMEGIVITTLERDAMECAMRFDFKATNNQAEYEALLVGLRVCIALGADELEIFSDSQVTRRFKKYKVTQIPREENEKADALSKLASATTCIRSKAIPVAHLTKPSTTAHGNHDSRNPTKSRLLDDSAQGILGRKHITRRYRGSQAHQIQINPVHNYEWRVIHERVFESIAKVCRWEEANQILKDIHSGVCGNHTGGKSLAHKVLRQGFYWQTLFAEA